MSISVNLPLEFKIISKKIFKETPEKVVMNLTINELKRRLIEYRYMDERFRKEYGMPFKEFKSKDLVKKHNYSFNIESDYCDWELAVDGIETIEKELKSLMEE